jgi:proteasome lid subunit RPN8/RPN11
MGGTYVVPPGISQKTIMHLRAYRTEAVCFWLGRSVGRVMVIDEVWMPQFEATAVSYDISPAEMLRVKSYLDESGQSLLVQTHSHPGTAFHSSRDDMNAASPWPGFISIVVPRFGHILADFWEEVEVYELLGAGKWRRLSIAARHARFSTTEAL